MCVCMCVCEFKVVTHLKWMLRQRKGVVGGGGVNRLALKQWRLVESALLRLASFNIQLRNILLQAMHAPWQMCGSKKIRLRNKLYTLDTHLHKCLCCVVVCHMGQFKDLLILLLSRLRKVQFYIHSHEQCWILGSILPQISLYVVMYSE